MKNNRKKIILFDAWKFWKMRNIFCLTLSFRFDYMWALSLFEIVYLPFKWFIFLIFCKEFKKSFLPFFSSHSDRDKSVDQTNKAENEIWMNAKCRKIEAFKLIRNPKQVHNNFWAFHSLRHTHTHTAVFSFFQWIPLECEQSMVISRILSLFFMTKSLNFLHTWTDAKSSTQPTTVKRNNNEIDISKYLLVVMVVYLFFVIFISYVYFVYSVVRSCHFLRRKEEEKLYFVAFNYICLTILCRVLCTFRKLVNK